jgi:hypothetical protein
VNLHQDADPSSRSTGRSARRVYRVIARRSAADSRARVHSADRTAGVLSTCRWNLPPIFHRFVQKAGDRGPTSTATGARIVGALRTPAACLVAAGALGAGHDELRRWRKRSTSRSSHLMGKGCLREDHPLLLGRRFLGTPISTTSAARGI